MKRIQKLTPSQIHKFYKELKQEIEEVYKNLK